MKSSKIHTKIHTNSTIFLPGTIQKSILFIPFFYTSRFQNPPEIKPFSLRSDPGESRLQRCLSLQGVRHLATAATDTKCGVTGHHWGRYGYGSKPWYPRYSKIAGE